MPKHVSVGQPDSTPDTNRNRFRPDSPPDTNRNRFGGLSGRRTNMTKLTSQSCKRLMTLTTSVNTWYRFRYPKRYNFFICDRICKKGSYTRIQFCDFMDV